jgi:hypothetical protein
MNKNAKTAIVVYDDNIIGIFKKKNGYISHSIHVRSINGVRMIGNGPTIYDERITATTIEEAISYRQQKIERCDAKANSGAAIKIKCAELFDITIGYEDDGKSLYIVVYGLMGSKVTHQFEYFPEQIIENTIISDRSFKKVFIHNTKEVVEQY